MPVDSPSKVQYHRLWCFLWYWPKQTVERAVKLPMIWDAMTPTWRHSHDVWSLQFIPSLGNWPGFLGCCIVYQISMRHKILPRDFARFYFITVCGTQTCRPSIHQTRRRLTSDLVKWKYAWVYNWLILLKFDRRLGNVVAETPVNIQSDTPILYPISRDFVRFCYCGLIV